MPITAKRVSAYKAGGSRAIILPRHLPKSDTMTLASDDRYCLIDASGRSTEPELLEKLQEFTRGESGKTDRASSGRFRFDEEHQDAAYAGLEIGTRGIHWDFDEHGNVVKLKRRE